MVTIWGLLILLCPYFTTGIHALVTYCNLSYNLIKPTVYCGLVYTVAMHLEHVPVLCYTNLTNFTHAIRIQMAQNKEGVEMSKI